MSGALARGYIQLIGVDESAYLKWSLPATVKDMRALRAILADPALCVGTVSCTRPRRLGDDGVADGARSHRDDADLQAAGGGGSDLGQREAGIAGSCTSSGSRSNTCWRDGQRTCDKREADCD